MKKARVRPTDINVGQAIPWDVYDDKGTLLLRRGQVIGHAGQLERIIGIGVYADSAALSRSRGEANVAVEAAPPSALRLLMSARRRMDLLASNLAGAIEQRTLAGQIAEVASIIDAACEADAAVALAIILLRQEGRYSTRHMVNVASVVRQVARTMNMPHAAQASLVGAALTMNLSMLEFQDDVKEQGSPLSPAQREQLEQHPGETCAMLQAAGIVEPVWLRAVREHHEHVDGSGYPGHLKADILSAEGQLLCLADVYCARVTPRAYRQAVASNMALRSILLERGKAFDPVLAGQFIKTMGVFPPGLLVKLANGEIGVVAKTGDTPNCPIVASIIGAHQGPLAIVLRRDTSQEGYGIVETVDPKFFSTYVNMESIWGAAASLS